MPAPTFASLGLPAPLVAVLAADGKETAFPIQADTLKDALGGRDVLGRGKTGSGKTLAFCLPMAARLGAKPARRVAGRPRGLVLAPTRELAAQIEETLKPLAAAYRLTTTTVFGGVKQGRQVEALKRGVDVVVACPGRLEDLIGQGFVTLDDVEITVLDEADLMADLGFLPVVSKLLARTPKSGQRMLFSATLDHGVDKIVKRFLADPVLHSVDSESSPVAAMTHHVFAVGGVDEKDELVRVLASGMSKRILFTRTKHHAKKLAKKLTAAGIPALDLQGNLSQPKRVAHLAAFADGSVKVLVATDVAARGVDINGVELVVHVDPPIEHKAYLHRSGRTARAGHAGDVVTICLPGERSDLAAVLKKAKISVAMQRVTATSPVVTGLVGEIAPYVAPPEPAPVSVQGTSQGANARRKRAAREAGGGIAGQVRGGRGGIARGGRGAADRGGAGRGAAGGSRRGAASGQPQGGARAVYTSETGDPTVRNERQHAARFIVPPQESRRPRGQQRSDGAPRRQETAAGISARGPRRSRSAAAPR